jgi:type IV pilus assembly protein PilM
LQIDVSALKSIFDPKLRPLIGVDISSTAVKMVELVDAGKGQPRVERYAIEPLAERRGGGRQSGFARTGFGNLAALLEAARYNDPIYRHGLADLGRDYQKDHLPANLRDQEMEIQVESEANQYIPFAIEEVNLDFQVIGPAPGNPDDVEVLLAASRKEKVEDRVAAAEVAELKPVVMDVEAYATQAAYELVTKQLPRRRRRPDRGADRCRRFRDEGHHHEG